MKWVIACCSEACPKKIIRFKHSDFIERTKRSANAFKFGDRGGSRMRWIPDMATEYIGSSAVVAHRALGGGLSCVVCIIGHYARDHVVGTIRAVLRYAGVMRRFLGHRLRKPRQRLALPRASRSAL